MSDKYLKLLVEAGNMSKRQTTAMWDHIDELRSALAWAVGEGAMACKGEASGRYSFVAVAEPNCDCDDVEPPAELLPVLMEAAQRAFLTERTSEGKPT
jgi:hypothetical protein